MTKNYFIEEVLEKHRANKLNNFEREKIADLILKSKFEKVFLNDFADFLSLDDEILKKGLSLLTFFKCLKKFIIFKSENLAKNTSLENCPEWLESDFEKQRLLKNYYLKNFLAKMPSWASEKILKIEIEEYI